MGLIRIAEQTVLAMGGGPRPRNRDPYIDYFGRSVNRLWMDGGGRFGFFLCRMFGWAEWSAGFFNPHGYADAFRRERLGRLTPRGKSKFAVLYGNGLTT